MELGIHRHPEPMVTTHLAVSPNVSPEVPLTVQLALAATHTTYVQYTYDCVLQLIPTVYCTVLCKVPPASDSHVCPFAYNNCSGPLSTDSNGQIRCLIRPSLIGPWTRLIGVPTTELPALICPHESPSHCQSMQLPLDIVNDYYCMCTIVLVYLSPSNGRGVKVSQVP